MPLIKKVLEYLEENKIPVHSKVLVGFSGGPDSTALVHVSVGLKNRFPLSVTCAYLDHGIRSREEIEREIARVGKACLSFQVPLVLERIERGKLNEITNSTGRSLEEIAREQRYQFFNKLSKELGIDFIALGHTLDDHVETLIMRFFQGADIGGLAGIPSRRRNIIRPLFRCTRLEVLDYLKANDLSYSLDSTNLDTSHLRNSVRLKLVPVIEKIFPGFRESLSSLAGKMVHAKIFLDTATGDILSWEKVQTGFRIMGKDFLAAPGVIRMNSLYQLYNKLNKDIRRIPYRFFACLLNNKEIRRRRIVLKGYGVSMSWRKQYLFVERDIVCSDKKGYFIVDKGNRKYIVTGAGLKFSFCAADKAGEKGLFQIDLDNLKGPIVIRSRKRGDRIRIKGGSKSIKKLLAEWKVSMSERWKIPILLDREGIAAVIGGPFGFQNRFRAGYPPQVVGMEASRTLTLEHKLHCLEEM